MGLDGRARATRDRGRMEAAWAPEEAMHERGSWGLNVGLREATGVITYHTGRRGRCPSCPLAFVSGGPMIRQIGRDIGNHMAMAYTKYARMSCAPVFELRFSESELRDRQTSRIRESPVGGKEAIVSGELRGVGMSRPMEEQLDRGSSRLARFPARPRHEDHGAVRRGARSRTVLCHGQTTAPRQRSSRHHRARPSE